MGVAISVTEFKAKCLDLIDKLSRHEIDAIDLTKRGVHIATVTAKERPRQTRDEILAEIRAWQAKMKGSITILDPDFDLTQPIVDLDDIEAYHGRVFPDDE